jgi:hypothetical protein
MPDITPTTENPLQIVISQLRSICEDRDLLRSTMDAGSVGRIAVHITNINTSVLASTQDHVNASKRLKDFAIALARIAKNTDPPNEVLTSRVCLVAASLRGASNELAGADRIPDWAARDTAS